MHRRVALCVAALLVAGTASIGVVQHRAQPVQVQTQAVSLMGWGKPISLSTTTTSTLPPPPPTSVPTTAAPKHGGGISAHSSRTGPRGTLAPSRGTGRCGGDLPPCWVMNRESGGNLNAYNPGGCSGRGCYGKWQCDPRTCSGHGTEEQQDAEARALWNNGKGCSNWAAC